MFTADQIVAHLVGDYILQSDRMAQFKTSSSLFAFSHAIWYLMPFLFLRPSRSALLFIIGTHFLIDRFRLARYVVWAKNWLLGGAPPWKYCTATGYPPERPTWMTVWLLIIADNTLHILMNGIAFRWL